MKMNCKNLILATTFVTSLLLALFLHHCDALPHNKWSRHLWARQNTLGLPGLQCTAKVRRACRNIRHVCYLRKKRDLSDENTKLDFFIRLVASTLASSHNVAKRSVNYRKRTFLRSPHPKVNCVICQFLRC